MKYYKFECGCSWPIIEESKIEGALPLMEVDPLKLPYCQSTWDLFARGDTKGVFQLESDLGKQWSKRLRPKNAEHLSAIGALIRPGTLRALDENGISMTAHYCKRANFEEPVESYHPVVDEILKSTYGSLVFQEQAMELSKSVAGFTLQEADKLRKSMGKKLASEMAKCKKIFIEGAKKVEIVSEKQAEEIFSWIEQSQRYSFNKSHSCCYGLTGYDTAYLKSHFPVQFYCSWLYYAKDKLDSQLEIMDLVEDARKFNIDVLAPDAFKLNKNFATDGLNIWFGITDIKGIGESQFNKLKASMEKNKDKLNTWENFVVFCSDEIPSSTIIKLISVGGFKRYNSCRQKLLAEYNSWVQLTDKEREWIKINFTESTIAELISSAAKPKKENGGCSNQNRVLFLKDLANLLINPPSPHIDLPQWLIWSEKDALGISLTCNAIDSCDTAQANTTCKEFLNGKTGFMIFGVEVRRCKEVVTKAGKSPGSKMAFMSISDSTGKVDDVICFPDSYKDSWSLLKEGNTVLIHGEKSRGSDSLLVKKVFQI